MPLDFVLATTCASMSALVGAGCYLAIVTLIAVYLMPYMRTPGAALLSYGGAVVFGMAPIVAALSALFGVAVYLIHVRHWLAAIVLCLGSSVVALGFVSILWLNDLTRYGPDASALVLYVPVAVFALFILIVGSTLTVRRIRLGRAARP